MRRTSWFIGDKCHVVLRGTAYDAMITGVSRAVNRDYDFIHLELTKTVTGLDGKVYTQTWIHPEPVQSYKLRKRLLED